MLFKIFTVLSICAIGSGLSQLSAQFKEYQGVNTDKKIAPTTQHIRFFIPPPGTSGNFSGNGAYMNWDENSGSYSGGDGSYANWDKSGGSYSGEGNYMNWSSRR
jgi:hypothetical protein